MSEAALGCGRRLRRGFENNQEGRLLRTFCSKMSLESRKRPELWPHLPARQWKWNTETMVADACARGGCSVLTLNLTTVHGALKTSADSPTKSPVQRVFFMKRAMGLEPTTLSLGS